MANESIEKLDKNFAYSEINGVDIAFYDFKTKPFELSGFNWFEDNDKRLNRLPIDWSNSVFQGLSGGAWHTAGGALRFKTNSSAMALKVKLRNIPAMVHMPHSGSSGFDIYTGSGRDKQFLKTAMPINGQDHYETLIFNNPESSGEMREYTIFFPLYNGVDELAIGLAPDAEIKAPSPYSVEKTVVYYGSSITQGGCASRPGNCHAGLVSRWLDANYINLGFSGGAKGEPEVAELIASIEMSALVIDYDHNAPNVAHLEKTYENFYRLIRAKQPELPIVLVSMPDVDNKKDEADARVEIIRKTYDKAKAAGEKVWFVDGRTLFGKTHRDVCTVDGCHPNDAGFVRMAETLMPVVEKALNTNLQSKE